jgi:hypothetical protein
MPVHTRAIPAQRHPPPRHHVSCPHGGDDARWTPPPISARIQTVPITAGSARAISVPMAIPGVVPGGSCCAWSVVAIFSRPSARSFTASAPLSTLSLTMPFGELDGDWRRCRLGCRYAHYARASWEDYGCAPENQVAPTLQEVRSICKTRNQLIVKEMLVAEGHTTVAVGVVEDSPPFSYTGDPTECTCGWVSPQRHKVCLSLWLLAKGVLYEPILHRSSTL